MKYFDKTTNTFELEQNDENSRIEYSEEEFNELIDCDSIHYVDQNKETLLPEQMLLSDDIIRTIREKECFSLIDSKSKFWWENLSEEKLNELKTWYQAWLDITKTYKVPNKLEWL